MTRDDSRTGDARRIAVLGGILYAGAVLAWAFATGVHFTTDDPASMAFGLGYASLGMFLVAAVPLYLLGRASLLSPTLLTVWYLADTIYQRWHVARPHDALASHLTVWPILFGLLLAAALAELAVRIGLDRSVGRLGLRRLF